MTAHVAGPSWTGADSGRYPGRFPLAVERHALGQVGRLIPGITSVTNHARYYTLHALVASEAEQLELPAEETRHLLRRCEVVLAGVTLAHGTHNGFGSPHGVAAIQGAVGTGSINVDKLAADGAYSRQKWGFTGPYLGSEYELGLVAWGRSGIRPGPALAAGAVRQGLGEILELSRRTDVSVEELKQAHHLCLCGSASGADGAHLRERLLPPVDGIQPHHRSDRRNQTLRLMLRLYELIDSEIERPSRVFERRLPFDQLFASDARVQLLDAYPAWVGLTLRSYTVAAWRNLWQWLVREIDGFMAIQALGQRLAADLPAGSVRDFINDLPKLNNGGVLLDAEFETGPPDGSAELFIRRLFIGAMRVGTLDDRVNAYFEGTDERMQQLTPTWLRQRIEAGIDKPMKVFAVDLVQELVARSQRIALTKATFDREKGRYKVPTRVFVRDGFVFRDSGEGGGGVSLRFDTMTTILAGVGLLEWGAKGWKLTDAGRSV